MHDRRKPICSSAHERALTNSLLGVPASLAAEAVRPSAGQSRFNASTLQRFNVCPWLALLLLPFSFFLTALPALADDVGDISADASAIYTGSTYHGYAEIRVDLQNRSHTTAHTVTLIFPNSSWDSGNSVRRISRTITLAAESLQTVSLLRPPLPSRGDGSIRVEVDDGHEGQIHAPNANNHCDFYGGGDVTATVFLSRSLNDSAVEHLFNANQSAFTAAMAVGPPDAPAAGMQPTTWMPDPSGYGYRQTNWLELDYATPQPVNKIVVYNTQSRHLQGSVTLIGTQGTNIATIPMSSGTKTSGSAGWLEEYDLTAPSAPVKTVRLNFGRSVAYNIAIDAVQISGPAGSQWASDARASSDNSAQAGAYTRSSANPVESLRAETGVTDWSETWLAYSPFDAIVLAQADMASMSPAVFGAIGNFLHAGGNIILFDTSDLPPAWHPWESDKLDGGMEYRIGFGRCFLFDTENPTSLDRSTIQTLRTAARESALYWQSLPQDSGGGESALPVHGTTKVPARSSVLAMFLFVLIIGPANLILLSRIKRRIWVLWTIPAISFATTMLIFVYSLLREGITPDTRICGLTVLDQISHQAATFGGESFYCPLTPGGGLKFDYETEATPLVNAQNYRGGSSREVDWSQSQHLASGWISARIPAYFHLRRSGTLRERIELSNNNGALQIVNGLGAPVRSLWLADSSMNLYQANNIPAGQKTGLIPAKQLQPLERSGPAGLRRDLGFGAVGADDLGSGAQKYLMPNTYIAVLDGNPFLENALTSDPNTKHTKTVVVVYGILENSNK